MNIKIDGYSVYYKKWHDGGLTKIENFFQGNRFLVFDEFCSNFKIKTNFLSYYGIYATRSPKNGSIFLRKILLNL